MLRLCGLVGASSSLALPSPTAGPRLLACIEQGVEEGARDAKLSFCCCLACGVIDSLVSMRPSADLGLQPVVVYNYARTKSITSCLSCQLRSYGLSSCTLPSFRPC